MARSRAGKYQPEYCDLLIAHMEGGLSFEAFAGVVKVTRKTLYNWAKRYPKFKEAKAIGEALSMLFLEKAGYAGMFGKVKNFNVTAWIFTMKNRCGWRDKHEIDAKVKSKTGKLSEKEAREMSNEDLVQAYQKLLGGE